MSNIFGKHSFVRAKDANSLTYFYNGRGTPVISDGIIKEMKKTAYKKKCNLRLNLHKHPNDDFHNMIIFQWKGTYVRPHYHMNKSETYNIIEGSQNIIFFDKNGLINSTLTLSKTDYKVMVVDKGQIHSSDILSDYVIFHESKVGPFLYSEDSLYPDWSLKKDNKLKIKNITT